MPHLRFACLPRRAKQKQCSQPSGGADVLILPWLPPETGGECLLGTLRRDSEQQRSASVPAQRQSLASGTPPEQQRNARRFFLRETMLHFPDCTLVGATGSALCTFSRIRPEVTSYPCSLRRSWSCRCVFVGCCWGRQKPDYKAAWAATDAHASFTNKGGMASPNITGARNIFCDPVLGHVSCSTTHSSARAVAHADNNLSSEELLRVLRSMRLDSASSSASRPHTSKQKSGCLSSTHRFTGGGRSAILVRNSLLLQGKTNDASLVAVSASQSLPTGVSRIPCNNCGATPCCCTSSQSSHSTSSASRVSCDRRSTTGIPHDVSAASPRSTSSVLPLASPPGFGSSPLRHACLSKSLLYHLRRSSPDCYSSLHLYAVAGLPVEPLLPDLPFLVLKLLKAGALASTKEIALCVHACATLLRTLRLRGEGGGAAAKVATAAVRASCQSPTEQQAAPADTTREAWLAVCLAFEEEFSRRLQHQFEYTKDHLQRLGTSPSPHRSSRWRSATRSRKKEGENSKSASSAGAPEQEDIATNDSPLSFWGTSTLRRRASSRTPDVAGFTASRTSRAPTDGISLSNDNALPAPESTGKAAASCHDTGIPAGIVASPSCCCSGEHSPLNASETTGRSISSARDDARARRTPGNNSSTVQVTEEKVGMRASTKSEQQTAFRVQESASKELPDAQIPYPHVVVPQDLSMFMSSYVALAKHSHHPVSRSLIAATACYLFLYSYHSSPHAFTLGASVVAKMAATLVADDAVSCASSASTAAVFFPHSLTQQSVCVLGSPYMGPFTAVSRPSKGCRRVVGCAVESRGTEEVRYDRRSSSVAPPAPTNSPRRGEKNEDDTRGGPPSKSPRRCLTHAEFCFSPLQLLAAATHHWIVEKAHTLRSHDWVCVLHALRYLLRVKATFPPLAVTAAWPVTREDHSENPAGGANSTRPGDSASSEGFSSAVGDGSAAARIDVVSPDAAAANPREDIEQAYLSGSSCDDTSIRHVDQRSASSAQRQYARGSTNYSVSQIAVGNVLQGTTQFQILNRELASSEVPNETNTLAAARAAQRAVAAAAAAFPRLRSLVSPFSDIAAAVPSYFLAGPRTAQRVPDLYKSWSFVSYPLHCRNNSGKDDQAAAASGWSGSVPAGGAALTVRPVSAGMAEFEHAEVTHPHNNIQVSVLAPPIPPPSVAVLLQALRHILLLFQQHLSESVAVTSLPAVALAAVELHGALLEKVRALQEHAALWQRPRSSSNRMVPVPRGLKQEEQAPEKDSMSIKNAEMSEGKQHSTGAPSKESHTQQVTERVFCGTGILAANCVFGVFAPVYDLLCQTRDAERLFTALPAIRGNRFSGSVIFLSALVEALRLADVENADQKRPRGTRTAEAAAGGRLALRGTLLDTQQRHSPPRRADAVPPFGSAHPIDVLSSNPVCVTQRLRYSVLRLFEYAASKVFLRLPSHSASSNAGYHRLDKSPGNTSVTAVADTRPARCPFAECGLSASNKVDTAAQVPTTLSSTLSAPRLACCPTPQDLIDLVDAACFLVSSSAFLDSCETRVPTTDMFHAGTPTIPSFHKDVNADILSVPGAVSDSPKEKESLPIVPEFSSSRPRTGKKDEHSLLMLLLRACCNHVVGMLKRQQEQRESKALPEPSQAARPREVEEGTPLLPRDVSTLAGHFHRCGLFSSAEFEAFGQYVMTAGRPGDDHVSYAAVFSGYDFVCLLQILVRPELPEGVQPTHSSCDGGLPTQESGARHDAWQSPFAARLAVLMLDGILPRCVGTFDDISLARLTLWLGNHFQKLQIYDRCSRSTTRNESSCSGESTAEHSRPPVGRTSYSAPPVPALGISMKPGRVFRLQLPAMRGLLERATRCLVQELLLRFCGLQVTSTATSPIDSLGASGRPSVSATRTMSAADRALSGMTRTAPSLPFQLLPDLSETSYAPPVSCPMLSSTTGRLCKEAQLYLTLLLGLSKLPRDLLLLSESRVAFTVPKQHVGVTKRCNVGSRNFAPSSAMGFATVDPTLEARFPPGALLLHTLLSKQQIEHFFVPCVKLTACELKVFFSALQHLPLLTANRPFSKATAAEKQWSKRVSEEYGQLVSCHNRCRWEFPTLREHVLRTVFQATHLVCAL